jgi:ActD protein
MSQRLLLAIFEREEDVLGATRASMEHGFKVADVHTPYAVHGMEEAMRLAPSRLPWVCFLLGLLGAMFKVWFEYWTTWITWPLNVGGKPWDSLPAFIPVTFEVMVLLAGVSTVIAFFLVARIRPGKKPVLPIPRITDDRFLLVLEETDAVFDSVKVRELFRQFNAVQVEERVEEVHA